MPNANSAHSPAFCIGATCIYYIISLVDTEVGHSSRVRLEYETHEHEELTLLLDAPMEDTIWARLTARGEDSSPAEGEDSDSSLFLTMGACILANMNVKRH